MESKTYISTEEKHDTVPRAKSGVQGTLGNWISPEDLESALNDRFPGCMRGKYKAYDRRGHKKGRGIRYKVAYDRRQHEIGWA